MWLRQPSGVFFLHIPHLQICTILRRLPSPSAPRCAAGHPGKLSTGAFSGWTFVSEITLPSNISDVGQSRQRYVSFACFAFARSRPNGQKCLAGSAGLGGRFRMCGLCAEPPPARAPGFPCRCCPPNVALLQDPRAVAVSACHYFQPQQPLARCPYIHPPAFAANVAVAAVDWAYWDLRHPECDCLGLLRPTYRARPPPRYIPSGVLLRCVAPLCGGGVHPNRRTLCKGDMLSVFGEPPP